MRSEIGGGRIPVRNRKSRDVAQSEHANAALLHPLDSWQTRLIAKLFPVFIAIF